MTYRVREDCRLCGGRDLERVLDLPSTPLANELPARSGGGQEEFPLWLAACGDCGHVQLPVVVDPDRLFRDYVYVSGTSPVFREHFRRYAQEVVDRHGLRPDDLVVEIGSNDGTMLRCFKGEGMRVVGVDPAKAIAQAATDAGIPTIPTFFTRKTAENLYQTMGESASRASAVVANNVFAHADDLAEIALGAKDLLRRDGVFVFEVSYLVDVLKKGLFDTIYHEHLSYHALYPLMGFFRRLGMSVVDAHRVDTHGGSIRVYVAPYQTAPLSIRAARLLGEELEMGLRPDAFHPFDELAETIRQRRDELLSLLRHARFGGGTIAAYGAPAKATTLLRTFGCEEMIDFVVDDSPLKQGRWLPGGVVPILPSSAIDERAPSHVVVLAWNFADSIVDRLADYQARGGTVVVPLPELQVFSRSEHIHRATVAQHSES